MDAVFGGIDFAMREATLFAACGFLFLGISDVTVDLIWIGRTLWQRCTLYRRYRLLPADRLPPPRKPGCLAVFIPAWQEAGVIAEMLRNTLQSFGDADYRLYVGCYPNDPATIAAVRSVTDARIRLVVGPVNGPTTKADCLNRLWGAMVADEQAEGRRFKAIILHDAEDVVHSAEPRIFDLLVERFDLVQLPVLPLIDPNSRWIAGHYADEFAESHGKELVVRSALGAALPSAGVGCAFCREALEELAAANGGRPFDSDSLTEDYELGLRLRPIGGTAAFVRLKAGVGRPMVVTQEYFPGTREAAVSQKARWMVGIALSGWDRLGWNGGLAERWMRLRDRQAVLASLLLFAGYVALALWTSLFVIRAFTGYEPQPISPVLKLLLQWNLALLCWRLAMRFTFVTRAYGWREGLRSLPRVVVSNIIAMMAARRAVFRYLSYRKAGSPAWDKTAHAFPAQVPAE